MMHCGSEGVEERQSVRDSDGERERPDLYKKEAEIFMDVSVLIGKPLGAPRPSPPITGREEEVNATPPGLPRQRPPRRRRYRYRNRR